MIIIYQGLQLFNVSFWALTQHIDSYYLLGFLELFKLRKGILLIVLASSTSATEVSKCPSSLWPTASNFRVLTMVADDSRIIGIRGYPAF